MDLGRFLATERPEGSTPAIAGSALMKPEAVLDALKLLVGHLKVVFQDVRPCFGEEFNVH